MNEEYFQSQFAVISSLETGASSPTSSDAWSNVEDPVTFDFFGFDFDFTDYADDSLFESDGVTKKRSLEESQSHNSMGNLNNNNPSTTAATATASYSNLTHNNNQQLQLQLQQPSLPSQEELNANLKRQKIEQYATAMRLAATMPADLPKPNPIVIPRIPSNPSLGNKDDKPTVTEGTPSTVTQLPPTRRAANRKPKAAVRRNSKTAFLPPPIAMNDIRRTFTKAIFTGYNSCDIKIIQKTVEEYTIKEMVAIHRYEGIQNPYGRNISRVKGRDAYVNMWSALVKSAPDFFFDIHETRAFYDPSTYHMIVASKFSWFGTRVMDVKYTTKLADTTANSSNTSDAKEETKPSSTGAVEATSTSSITDGANTDGAAQTVSKKEEAFDESIFCSTKSNEFDTEEVDRVLIDETDADKSEVAGKFYVDTTPLQQKLQMSCKGTFLVYIYTDYLQEALRKQQELQLPQPGNKKAPTASNTSNPATNPAAHTATTMAGNTVDTSLPSNINLPLDPTYVNKIFKLEFIYTSSDEKLIQEATPSCSSSSTTTNNTASDTNTTNTTTTSNTTA